MAARRRKRSRQAHWDAATATFTRPKTSKTPPSSSSSSSRTGGPFARNRQQAAPTTTQGIELPCELTLRSWLDAHHGAIRFHTGGLEFGRNVKIPVWPF